MHTLEEKKICLQVTRILKASQKVQAVGGYIDQLPTLDNMAEREAEMYCKVQSPVTG
jgi:hypothetical protein